MAKKISKEKLFLIHLQDQLESWVRDNYEDLIDFFKNHDEMMFSEAEELDEEMDGELDEYIFDTYIPIGATLFNKLVRYQDGNPVIEGSCDEKELEKFARNATWKDVALLLLNYIKEEFIEVIDDIEEGEVIEDEDQIHLLKLLLLTTIVSQNEKKK